MKYCNAIFICPLLLVTLFAGCEERVAHHDLEEACWIKDTIPLPDNDSSFYGNLQAPLFRKEFIAGKNLKSARILISAAGYYRFYINGQGYGNNILSPPWTDYSVRVYYSEYDITESIVKGLNCLGVSLGNGFYNPLPLKMWGHLNLRETLTVGKPCFIAKIVMEYNDGSVQEVITDDSWKFTYGPVMRNDVYLGVVYNASYEKPGWNTPGFEDDHWGKAVTDSGPEGQLIKQFFPPVVVVDTIVPADIYRLADKQWIIDMGVNYTGVYRVRMKGKTGDTVVFRFGERIYESGELNPMTTVCGQIKREGMGGPGAPAIAWQTDTYIFGNDSIVYFSPEFTFHTCRFIEINGLENKPQPSDFRGLFLSTDLRSNNFRCSSDLIDSIQDAAVRTFKANLTGVQSDCPAREKFGYGGDLNATSEAFIYNFDIQDFYRKTVYDWVDALNDSIFVDTAPYVGINYCGLSWESAFLITQYYLYLYYNDRDIVNELYDVDVKWMDKVARIHPDGIVNSGLSDHESLESVPVELSATAHYLECARIMKIFAREMKDEKGLSRFTDLETELSELMVSKFWLDSQYKVENKQFLYSVLLYYDLVQEDDVEEVSDSLKLYIEKAGGKLTTGIFGTKYILSALSKTGKSSFVYEVINNTDYPGWGYMIKNGATTLWETWKESDNTYSNCHPMFGSISEWFYKYLGGIRPDPDYPGFSRFILSPDFPDGLGYVECNYMTGYGEIVSEWKKRSDKDYVYCVQIPDRCIAYVMLPQYVSDKIGIKNIINKRSKHISLSALDGIIQLSGGQYEISFTIK